MAVSTSRSWATLTPELLSSIHEILAEDFLEAKAEADQTLKIGWHRRTRDRQTALPPLALKHVALVNKHWHLVSNQDLYRTIFIQREQTIQRLVRTVTNNPELLPLVKSVTVNYKYNRLPTQPKALNKAMANRRRTSKLTWQFLHLLRPGRLRHLAVETESLNPFPGPDAGGLVIACLQGLTSLSLLPGDREQGAGTFDRLVAPWTESAMPTLTALSLVLPNFILWDESKSFPTGLKLKSLRLVNPAALTAVDLRRLLCWNTLECLSLTYPDRLTVTPSELRTELLQVAPRLRALHVQAPGTWAQDQVEFSPTLVAMLSSAQSLHTLRLTLDKSTLDALGLACLPVTLRDLAICVDPRRWSPTTDVYVDTMVQTANAVLNEDLPSLARLNVTCYTLVRGAHAGMVDHSAFDASIAAAAAAKDISLTFLGVFPDDVDWY